MYQLQDDGKLRGPSGNVIDLGKGTSDPVAINASNLVCTGTVSFPGVLLLGANSLSLAVPAGTSAATNTTATVAGTGATVFVDTKFNGSLGTTPFTINDLVRACKVAGILIQ